jgi:beta-mannosidase
VSIHELNGADFWKYRTYVDRFPNEGGVIGVSSPATLRQFLPGDQLELLSPAWDHHDNPFAAAAFEPGQLGRAYATVERWTGRNPEDMDWETYAFASALLQAEGLTEYINNYRSRMYSSASAIFWMYNDSWPVTHGWTIVDYYRRKKLAYHPVRRAFQPMTAAVADRDKEIVVFGVNDTDTAWKGTLRYGLFNLAGGLPFDEQISVELKANASTVLVRFDKARWQSIGLNRAGAFALLLRDGQTVSQHRLFLKRFKDLAFVTPTIKLALEKDSLRITSDVFAWGVCLDVDGELLVGDNCFDVIPGISYVLPWSESLGQPNVARIGSRDVLTLG